jgi:hypothetical protein
LTVFAAILHNTMRTAVPAVAASRPTRCGGDGNAGRTSVVSRSESTPGNDRVKPAGARLEGAISMAKKKKKAAKKVAKKKKGHG